MKCSYCQHEIPSKEALFCPACGKRLQVEAEKTVEETPEKDIQSGTVEEQAVHSDVASHSVERGDTGKAAGKGKWSAGWLIPVVCVLMLVFGCVLFSDKLGTFFSDLSQTEVARDIRGNLEDKTQSSADRQTRQEPLKETPSAEDPIPPVDDGQQGVDSSPAEEPDPEPDTVPESEAEPRQTVDGEYVFPQSSTAYLTDQELTGLDKTTLRLARNEICARHGKIFRDAELRAYFESKSWYTGTVEPDEFDRLNNIYNAYEVANIELIKEYEAKG